MGVPLDGGASLLLIGSVGHALRAVEDARARGGRRDPRQEFRRWYCGLPPRRASPAGGPLASPPRKVAISSFGNGSKCITAILHFS